MTVKRQLSDGTAPALPSCVTIYPRSQKVARLQTASLSRSTLKPNLSNLTSTSVSTISFRLLRTNSKLCCSIIQKWSITRATVLAGVSIVRFGWLCLRLETGECTWVQKPRIVVHRLALKSAKMWWYSRTRLNVSYTVCWRRTKTLSSNSKTTKAPQISSFQFSANQQHRHPHSWSC